MAEILNGQLGNILNFISAASGLGTAAMGLVDASKAFGGGPSNFGFDYIENAISPFFVPKSRGSHAFDKPAAMRTLRANWINGVAKGDQKAKAKSLVHLYLTQGNTKAIATVAGVDAGKLESLVQKTVSGTALSQEEITVLGQFDAVLSAVLDSAYERGDQKYRNACKFLSLAASTILGAIGGWIVYGNPQLTTYVQSQEFAVGLLVGVSATPLAPIAKDLATSLRAAVTAAAAAKR